MIISLDDMRIAQAIFSGKCSRPAMYGADMEAAVYSALAGLYDAAARGAASMGRLRQAWEYDFLRDKAQKISDLAAGRC